MNKQQRETEKSSAVVVARERAAVLKLLQELGYGLKAKTLTGLVLTKFGERNVRRLFPNSHTIVHKTPEDIYSTFKGLYRHTNVLTWSMAMNKPNKEPYTKTVASFTRYLSTEDTRNAATNDDEDDAPRQATHTTTTQMTRWGAHFISRPPTDDEDQREDTEEDEE